MRNQPRRRTPVGILVVLGLVLQGVFLTFTTAIGGTQHAQASGSPALGWNTLTSTYNQSASANNSLSAISCITTTNCYAVGYYTNGSGYTQTLVENWTGSTWNSVTSYNSSTTQNNQLTGISCTSSTNCWAVGYYNNGSVNQTLAEYLSGGNFNNNGSSLNSGTSHNFLTGVSCNSSSDCWASGYYYNTSGSVYQTLIEHYTTSWAVASSPNVPGTHNYLTGISCSSSSNCFASGYYWAGSYYQVLVEQYGTSWNGVTAQNTSASQNNYLSGVTCYNSSTCWLVGYYYTGTVYQNLIEEFNGTSINGFPVQNSSAAQTNYLTGVTCEAWADCMASGYYCQSSGCSGSSGAQTEVEHWDGTTWYSDVVPNQGGTANQNGLHGVSCVPSSSPDNCIAVGNYCENSSNCPGGTNASSQTLAIQYGGALQDPPSSSTNWGAAAGVGDPSLSSPGAPSSIIGPVNTESGNLYRSYQDTSIAARGPSLSLTRAFNSTLEATSQSNNNVLLGDDCLTSTNCWAVGYYCTNIGAGQCALGSYAQTLVLHYDGTSWKTVPSPDQGSGLSNRLQAISCDSATDCAAVGYYNNSGGYAQNLAMHWDGTSWKLDSVQQTSTTQNNYMEGVSCTSTTFCMMVGYYYNGTVDQNDIEELTSANTWTGVTSANSASNQTNQLQSVSCMTSTSCMAAGLYCETANSCTTGVNQSYQTEDNQWNGTSWSLTYLFNTSASSSNLLTSVSCTTSPSTLCMFGGMYNAGGYFQVTVQSWNGTTWSFETGQNQGTSQNNQINAVSCTSTTNCELAGFYDTSGGTSQTMTQSWSGGSSTSNQTSGNTSTSQNNDFYGISCTSSTNCWAAGYWVNGSGIDQTEAQSLGSGTFSFPSGSGTTLPTGGAGNVWSSGIEGAFGFGWSSNFATTSLFENTANTQVTIVDATGSPVVFNLASGSWVAPMYNASTLTSSGGVWSYTKWNGDLMKFNSSGQLTSESDRNGNAVTLTYVSGNLSTVQETTPSVDGRELTFTFTGSVITKVVDPDSQNLQYTYDASGDLVKVQNQAGNTMSFTYDGNHSMTSETDYDGNTVNYAYSLVTGQVTSVTTPAGAGGSTARTTSYAYTSGTNTSTTTITDPLTNETQLTFNYKLLTQRVDAYGNSLAATSTYLYDPNTLSVYQKTDPLSTVTAYQYDINTNLLKTTVTPTTGTPASISTSATYNSLNEPITTTDANGNVTTNFYDSDGNLCWSLVGGTPGSSCTTQPTGAKFFNICESTSCTYNSNTYYQGDVEYTKDENGNQTTPVYDTQGDVTSSTDAGSNKSCFTYDSLSRRLTSTPPLGSCSSSSAYTTTVTYNALNQVLNTTYPDPSNNGSTTTKYNTYDNNGNLLTTKLPLTGSSYQWTTNTYDADNEKCWTDVTSASISSPTCGTIPRVSGTDATTSIQYDADGNVSQVNDRNNNATTYAYNALNQKTSATDALSDKASWTYDANGNVLTAISPDGNASGCTGTCITQHTTTNTYDGYNRLTKVVDPNNNTSTISYDANGNKITATDGSSNVTSWGYDNKNELCWTFVSTAAASGSACSSPPSYTSGNGPVIKMYDSVGNVTQVEDQNQNKTNTTYNNLNQVCWTYLGSSSNACGTVPSGATSYTYDADGNLTQTKNPLGNTIYGTYNDAGLICVRDDGTSGSSCGATASSTLTNFSYDAAGRRTGMGDGTGSSSWVYNQLDQLTSYTNGASAQVQYVPDAMGNETKITYPSGTIVQQAFSAANRTCWTYVGTSSNACGSVPSGATSYTFDASGNLTAEDLPNGINNTYSYDGTSSISSISDGSGGATFAATYGRNGDNLVSSDSSQSSNKDYTYTAQNRVCYAYSSSQSCGSSNSGAYKYSYDAVANITTDNANTQKFNTGGSSNYDELCWSGTTSGSSCGTTPSGDTSYTYNADGARTKATPSSGSASNYSFNDYDQMTQYQLGSGTATTYGYDGTGLMMSKATGGTTTYLDWSGTGSTPALLQEKTGSAYTTYVYDPAGRPISETTGGSTYYYSTDNKGSVRALTDSSGTVKNTDSYDPYGNLASSTGSTANNLLFQGQYLESNSSLYYLRARWYDSVTGQFMSVDPAVASTGQPYAFTGGDPVNAVDPSGNLPSDCDSACLQYNNWGGNHSSVPRGTVPAPTQEELGPNPPFLLSWGNGTAGGPAPSLDQILQAEQQAAAAAQQQAAEELAAELAAITARNIFEGRVQAATGGSLIGIGPGPGDFVGTGLQALAKDNIGVASQAGWTLRNGSTFADRSAAGSLLRQWQGPTRTFWTGVADGGADLTGGAGTVVNGLISGDSPGQALSEGAGSYLGVAVCNGLLDEEAGPLGVLGCGFLASSAGAAVTKSAYDDTVGLVQPFMDCPYLLGC